jgi:hypothetical protein
MSSSLPSCLTKEKVCNENTELLESPLKNCSTNTLQYFHCISNNTGVSEGFSYTLPHVFRRFAVGSLMKIVKILKERNKIFVLPWSLSITTKTGSKF